MADTQLDVKSSAPVVVSHVDEAEVPLPHGGGVVKDSSFSVSSDGSSQYSCF